MFFVSSKGDWQKKLEIIRERRKMWEQRLPDVYGTMSGNYAWKKNLTKCNAERIRNNKRAS